MIPINLENVPNEINDKLLTDAQLLKQIRRLKTPGGANIRKVLDYSERRMISAPVGSRSGGKKMARLWLPWTGAEFDTAVRLTARRPREIVAEGRRLMMILWGCADFRDVLGHRSDFRGKEDYAGLIFYWSRMFSLNMSQLEYDLYPELISGLAQSLKYFRSDELKLLVLGLTYGFYDDYTVDADGNLVRPQNKELPSIEKAPEHFLVASEEPSAAPMVAKSRS